MKPCIIIETCKATIEVRLTNCRFTVPKHLNFKSWSDSSNMCSFNHRWLYSTQGDFTVLLNWDISTWSDFTVSLLHLGLNVSHYHYIWMYAHSTFGNTFRCLAICGPFTVIQTCHSMAIDRLRSPSITWNVAMVILLSIAQMPIGELFSFSYFSVVYCVMILTILLSRDHVYSKELDICNKKVIDCSLYLYH